MANTLRHTTIKAFKKQNIVVPLTALRQKTTAATEKNILMPGFKDIPATNYTVSDFVWQNLDRWPDKTATVCAVTGHGYTYAQVHRLSMSFAASLRTKLRLKEDDKVAIILPNLPEYPCVLFGVLQAGCIASMMNPIYTPDELQRQLEMIECKAIISSKISYANIQKALTAMKSKIPVILTDNEVPEGTIKFAEFAEDLSIDTDCLKSVRRGPEDIAVLPFSSGTTGFPKAVVLTHRNVVSMNQMIADPEIVAIKETTATHQSVLPAILPFFHIFGFNAVLLNQMHFGCKLVTMPYFKPELFLKTLVQHKANVLFLVPPMVVFLGKHPAVTSSHLETVHGIICGAAPVSPSDAIGVIEKNKNINFRQGYGLTESSGGISVGSNTNVNHASVGKVFGSCRIKVASLDTQEALGPGEEGEVWMRGPQLMREYYKNEAATKEVLTEDGWFKSGDIGKYDEEGYLYITDRLKELIKVKGFQVAPAELETVLRTHPKVLDCAVLGIPDPVSGEVPKAFVVLQPNQTVDRKEILEYINDNVAVFKRLKDVQFIDEVPKNAAGKILRKDLKEKYC